MYNLTPVAECAFAPDTYVLDLYRLSTDGIVSISSDQRLSLLSTDISKGPVRSLATDHGNLTSVRVVGESSVVCTAGENGTAAVWDLRQEAAKVAQFQACDAPILSLACEDTTHSIAVGTELQSQASIYIWDMRASPTQKRQYTEVHSDDITELKFHPNQPNILLSGSTDGLVNICDINIADEDEVILQTFNHDASIHHAGFLSTTDVYAVSHDERFAVYTLDESHEKGTALADYGDIRDKIGCQYVANVSTKVDGSGGIIGAGAQDRQLFSLVHLSREGRSWKLDRETCVALPGGHGEEIVRGFCFFDKEQVVYTGGEDGKIKAWRPGN